MKKLGVFFRNEAGATAIEYGLIAAFLSIIVVASFALLSEPVGGLLSGVAAHFADIDL